MSTKAEIIADLEKHLPAMKAKGEAGCESTHIQWAMGDAILTILKQGYELTDLDWFKNTPYYTGATKSLKQTA